MRVKHYFLTPPYPPPPQIDGFIVQTYALYFAQTMLFGLRPRGCQNSPELVRQR